MLENVFKPSWSVSHPVMSPTGIHAISPGIHTGMGSSFTSCFSRSSNSLTVSCIPQAALMWRRMLYEFARASITNGRDAQKQRRFISVVLEGGSPRRRWRQDRFESSVLRLQVASLCLFTGLSLCVGTSLVPHPFLKTPAILQWGPSLTSLKITFDQELLKDGTQPSPPWAARTQHGSWHIISEHSVPKRSPVKGTEMHLFTPRALLWEAGAGLDGDGRRAGGECLAGAHLRVGAAAALTLRWFSVHLCTWSHQGGLTCVTACWDFLLISNAVSFHCNWRALISGAGSDCDVMSTPRGRSWQTFDNANRFASNGSNELLSLFCVDECYHCLVMMFGQMIIL